MLLELLGVGRACKCVIVADEIKAIVLGLKLQVLAHCAEVVAYVKLPGRLYTRKNSQISLLTLIDTSGQKYYGNFVQK